MKFKTICSVVCQQFWCGYDHLRFDLVKCNCWVFLHPPSSSQTNQPVKQLATSCGSSLFIISAFLALAPIQILKPQTINYLWLLRLPKSLCSSMSCLFYSSPADHEWMLFSSLLLPLWCKLPLSHLDHSSCFLMFSVISNLAFFCCHFQATARLL